VDVPKMRVAVDSLGGLILRLQGDGGYDAVKQFMGQRGVVAPQTTADLARLGSKRIPVDVVFEQGADVLGLER
jgi:hypothetical protein